jgi:hypothetical protein
MHFRLLPILLLFLLPGGSFSARAQSGYTPVAITFEGLAATGAGGSLLPVGYGGLNFNVAPALSTYYINNGSFGTSYVAFSPSASARTFTLTSQTPFYLDGINFFSRRTADAAGDVYLVLYNGATTVYNGLNERDGRITFNGTSTTYFPLVEDPDTRTSSPFTGLITGFGLAFTHPTSNDLDHLAMDNLQLRILSSIPEPAVYGLLAGGFALSLAGLRRRFLSRRRDGPDAAPPSSTAG